MITVETPAFTATCDSSFVQNYEFATYLINHQEHEKAQMLLKHSLQDSTQLSLGQRDSLVFRLGWSHYLIKSLDSALYYLQRVNYDSKLSAKGQYYQYFIYLFTEKDQRAAEILKSLMMSGDIINLAQFNQTLYGGLQLIRWNFTTFDTIAKKFTYQEYQVTEAQRNLILYSKKYKEYTPKKMWKAAMISAFFPGFGKFYAGYKGQTMGTFLPVALLSIVAAESYLVQGYTHPNFWIFGSAFATFYIGNIWGSALSVKIKKHEMEDEIRHKVLDDVHSMLRHIFE